MPRRTTSLSRIAVIAIVGLLVACGSSSLRPAGTSCMSDGDCAAGLSCLGLGMFSDAGSGCTTAALACSKQCKTDTDCVSVGPKFKCFASCGGTNTCGQTQ